MAEDAAMTGVVGTAWGHCNDWGAWTWLGSLQWLECMDTTGAIAMVGMLGHGWARCNGLVRLDMTVAIAMIGMFGHGWGHYNDWHAWAWAGPLQ